MKILVLALSLISLTTNAATLQCSGTVENIGLHAPDKIMLRLSSMNTAVFICNPSELWTVSGTSYKTSAETCKMMVSMLMHAKSTKAEMGNVWFDGDDVPESCNSWQSWKTTNVRMFLY
jgi:hypothetical protein